MSTIPLLIVACVLFSSGVNCGLFSRNSAEQQITLHSNPQQQPESTYNPEHGRVRYQYNRNDDVASSVLNNKKSPASSGPSAPIPFVRTGGGLSAWGIIAMIVFIILVGMIGYYGIMCYPLLCSAENAYNTMGESSSSSSGTPMHKIGDFDDFEGKRNYSSRSTTPSKSHE